MNISSFKKFTAIASVALLMSACSAPNKVIYLPDADSIPVEVIAQSQPIANPLLSAGDLLNIAVYGTDLTAVAPFNRGQYLDAEGKVTITAPTTNLNNNQQAVTEYYLVDNEGNIDFPIIGTIHVAGKTKQELAKEITDDIYPKYVKNEPIVEVRLMNFNVTVLGQVKNPGQYVSRNERLNLLEAIALAGDLDIKADRENIILYRTNADGTREIHRLNLRDSNLLLSPYFAMQQNDVIYVYPNASARQNAWQLPQGWTLTLSIVGGASSLASLVIGIINLSK